MKLTSTLFREIFALYCMVQADILLGGTAAFAPYYDPDDSPSNSQSAIHIRSQLVSAGRVFHPIGSCLDMYFIEKFGRKTTLQLLLALASFSWMLTAISHNFFILLLSRVLISFLIGVTSAGIVYMSEMATETRRNFYISMFTVVEVLGYLVINLLEYLYEWRIAAAVLSIHFAITVGLLAILPESKYWYISKNNDEGALKSTMWFNEYRKDAANDEVKMIKQQIQQSTSEISFFKCIKTPSILKLFALSCLIQILRVGTGYEIFIGYSTDFWKLFDVPYNLRQIPIIFECVNLVSAIVMSIIITCKVKTRTILLYYSGVMSLTATSIIFYCVLLHKPYYILLTIVVFIHMLSSGGLYQLLWVAIPELFPTAHCSYIIPAFCTFTFLIECIYLSFFPLVLHYVGFINVLWFFLLNALGLFLVSYFLLSPKPVVEGNPIESIQM